MSRKTSSNNVQLGLFVTAGVLLFTIAVYYIGSKQSMFGTTFRISSVFNNVGGLQVGNNVRYSGINIGTVKDIVFVTDSTVRVLMVLDAEVQPYLKKDAVASIGSDGLVGSMLINIRPGNGRAPAVGDGDEIASFSRIKPEDMLNTLGNTNETVALISENLLQITGQLNEGSGALSMLLRDSLLAVDLRTSVHDLRRTSALLAGAGQQLRQMLAGLQAGEGLLGQLLTDTTLLDQLTSSASRIDTMLSRQVAPFLGDLQHSADDLNAATAGLNTLLADLEAGKGPAGTLLRDSAAARDIRQILENLNEGSDRLNENMEAMRHNFLFRGYFRKLEKEERKAARRQNELEPDTR